MLRQELLSGPGEFKPAAAESLPGPRGCPGETPPSRARRRLPRTSDRAPCPTSHILISLLKLFLFNLLIQAK